MFNFIDTGRSSSEPVFRALRKGYFKKLSEAKLAFQYECHFDKGEKFLNMQ